MIEGRIGGTSPAHRDCAYSEGKSSTSCQHERFQIHLAVSRPGGTGIGLQGGRRKCAGADPVPLGCGVSSYLDHQIHLEIRSQISSNQTLACDGIVDALTTLMTSQILDA